MPPGRYDLLIYRGDSWSKQLTILSADCEPVDLTGATVEAQARAGGPDGPLLFAFVVTTADPTSGVVVLSLPADASWNGGRTVYDLQLTAADATVSTLLSGDVIVTPDVTRPGP